ncbi:unnamed protein product [Prunus armeniaca]
MAKNRKEWRSSKATIDLLQQQLKNAYLSLDFDLDNVLQMELNVKGALQEKKMYWKLMSRVQ